MQDDRRDGARIRATKHKSSVEQCGLVWLRAAGSWASSTRPDMDSMGTADGNGRFRTFLFAYVVCVLCMWLDISQLGVLRRSTPFPQQAGALSHPIGIVLSISCLWATWRSDVYMVGYQGEPLGCEKTIKQRGDNGCAHYHIGTASRHRLIPDPSCHL